jgi:hypothetical protein
LLDAAEFTVGGTLTNNGALQRTQTVNGSSDVSFFNTGGYGGVTLNANGTDLGSTTVRIRGNQDCTIVAGETVRRCFDISPTNTTGRNAAITFYFANSEIPGGQSCSNLNGYRWTGSGWEVLTLDTAYGTNGRSCGSDPRSLRVKNVASFSDFVLQETSPTAITLRGLTARSGGLVGGWLLLVGSAAAALWLGRRGLLLRRKRAK